MRKLYRKINFNKYKMKSYSSTNSHFKSKGNKDKNFYKKTMVQVVWCIFIVLLVILIKSINSPITNKTTKIMKTSIEEKIDIQQSLKQVVKYVQYVPKIPDKVVNVFSNFSNEKKMDMNFVVPLEGDIISSYGENIDPLLNKKTFQRGVDIVPKEDKDIVSIGDGQIIEVGEGKSLGKYIKVKHNQDIFSLYGHCSDIMVLKGQRVKKGEKIAKIYKKSNENSYFHFELWVKGEVVDPVNYISFDKKML